MGALVLSSADRIIHSAVHLFYDGEFEHGFRDISDIDLLLREFSKDEKFWKSLISRSTELRLKEPVFYALRYCYYFLKTPIPEQILNLVTKQYSETRWIIMDFLFKRALLPNHSTCQDRWNGLAVFVLYIRGHLLKMPLYLLIPHLLRKGWMRLSGKAGH
ncbi:nucleotidyltransferase family protein [methane-oxidizing endosymbiont of Gigantopelta aegis]|uniref:nucleotidyltransferase family protein n=1 Tax=methane-oxidizing endosymbiont of Gigantopelta aegis TaxID=2794938 RepID=UPI001BE4D5A3